MAHVPQLRNGDFVRVKSTNEYRPGQDGMVMEEDDGEMVCLFFGCDRYNRSPSVTGITFTGLREAWNLDELDLSSIER